MFAKYAKAIAAALAGVIATAVVAYTNGDVASIETIQVALAGGLGTLFTMLSPKNAAPPGLVEMTQAEYDRLLAEAGR